MVQPPNVDAEFVLALFLFRVHVYTLYVYTVIVLDGLLGFDWDNANEEHIAEPVLVPKRSKKRPAKSTSFPAPRPSRAKSAGDYWAEQPRAAISPSFSQCAIRCSAPSPLTT